MNESQRGCPCGNKRSSSSTMGWWHFQQCVRYTVHSFTWARWHRRICMLLKGTISTCRPALTSKLSPHPKFSLSSDLSVRLFFLSTFIPSVLLKPLSSYTIHSLLFSHSSVASSASSSYCSLASFFLAMPPMNWPWCVSRRIDFSFGLCVKPYLNSTQRNFLFPRAG